MKKQLLFATAMLLGSALAAMASGLTAGTPHRVAQSAEGLMAPVWSPDGTQIAATGPGYTGIYVFKADGSDGSMITEAVGAGYKMAWSADGREVIGRTNVRDGVLVLHETKAWDVATGDVRTIQSRRRTNSNPLTGTTGVALLTNMTENAAEVTSAVPALADYAGSTVINPALSPDGSMIAFQIVANGMFVINADGTNLRSLGQGSNPAWMPDNNTIVYTVVRDNGNEYTGSTIMTVSLNDGTKQVLMDNDKYIPVRPAITKDGSRLAFENVADQSIYVVTLKK